MSEKDSQPLPSSVIRNLQDKLYDKRKLGALEVEKMIREFLSHGNHREIDNVVRSLGGEFVNSSNPHSRKGGLISLAAVAIGLGKASYYYCPALITPVIKCLFDSDSRVRYYACESLYNIVKITKGESLQFFNDMFDALSKCASDPDISVRKGSAQLDRVVKDIVMESASFDIASLIPLLRERVYTKDPNARQFVISWISTLDSVPDINMIVFLPEILDGLFQMLSDSSIEIRRKCAMLLEEVLTGINKSPAEVDYSAMINILIAQCQFCSSEVDGCLTQTTAMHWIHEFLILAKEAMLPYVSGLLAAILPCLSYTDPVKRLLMEGAAKVNEELLDLVKSEAADEVDMSLEAQGADKMSNKGGLNVPCTMEVLCRMMTHDNELTRLAALRWIDTLFDTRPIQVFLHTEEIFPLLLKILSDASTVVVHWDLALLVKLCTSPAGLQVLPKLPGHLLTVPDELKAMISPETSPYLLRFMLDLVRLLDTDRRMLDDRGELIITDLCSKLGPERVYRTMAEIILHLDDVQSAFILVQLLNRILLTQAELHLFRNDLKAINTEASCNLFCCLYRAWSHNVVALLSLCLLTQNYEHSSKLIKFFGEIEITVETLTEIDQLIQLLESPIFAYLRLHLLDGRHSANLQETLYGLLMCLPQTEAFHMLRRRLDCIPDLPIQGHTVLSSVAEPDRELISSQVNFDTLLAHFQKVQTERRTKRNTQANERRLNRGLSNKRIES